jgi:predicted small lipoprotein YifL
MIKTCKNRILAFATLLVTLGALASFAGCEAKGPAEKAGAAVDQGVQNAKDAVNPPGPGEKAGRDMDKALKP